MQLDFNNLKPYVSVSIFKSKDSSLIVKEIANEFNSILKTLNINLGIINPDTNQSFQEFSEPYQSNKFYCKGGWFSVLKTPSWFGANNLNNEDSATFDLTDIQNHLVLIGSYNSKYIVVHSTLSSLRDRINELIVSGAISYKEETQDGYRNRVEVVIREVGKPLSRKEIEKAFVRGEAKNIWLQGLHSPIVLKADRKILSGLDLRYALDSIGDQTFTYSAAISKFEINEEYRVGVSHKKNTLWTKGTKKFDHFIKEIEILTSLLSGKIPFSDSSGMPILAKSLEEINLDDLYDGFEVYFESTLQSEAELIDATLNNPDNEYDFWQKNFFFEVVEQEVPNNTVDIVVDLFYKTSETPIKLLKTTIKPVLLGNQNIEIKISISDYFVEKYDWRLVFFDKAFIYWKKHLVLRYGSGHIIQGGELYLLQFRSPIFQNWTWLDFNGKFNLKKEKPSKEVKSQDKVKKVYDPYKIGKQDSLFCYTKNDPSSLIPDSILKTLSNQHMLLCDDGSGEIADFIILDPKMNLLVFIHIKGAKSNTNQIAIDRLSELTGMAQKNLSMLENTRLSKNIENRTTSNNKKLVWNAEGTPITRDIFVKSLNETKSNLAKHVVLFLPRVKENAWVTTVEDFRNGVTNLNIGRMKQLNELLSSAEESLKRLGATMSTIGIKEQ